MVSLDLLMKSAYVSHLFLDISKLKSFNKFILQDPLKIEDELWYKERYCQSQLFTFTHGMNIINNLYSKKRKGYK